MNTAKFEVLYVPRQGEGLLRRQRWDGDGILALGYPLSFVLESFEGKTRLRDLKSDSAKRPLEFDLSNKLSHTLELESGEKIIFRRLRKPLAYSQQPNPGSVSLPVGRKEDEDKSSILFWRMMRNLTVGFALVLVASLLIPKPEEKKEELVPPQFAKIIMKRPKANPQASRGSAGGGAGAKSQASKTAIAKAFSSASLQKSIAGLLKGGLAKFATDTGGKNAGRMIASASGATGSSLDSLANSLLGGKGAVQVASVGSGSGYGMGEKAGVAGQGSGYIGLDTKAAEVEEGLTKEEVGRVIHAHMSEIRYCYESAILQNPNLEGKVLIDFKIGGDGKVKTASEKESGVSDSRVSDCVIRRLYAWQFPNPRGGVTVSVTYPFLFKTMKR